MKEYKVYLSKEEILKLLSKEFIYKVNKNQFKFNDNKEIIVEEQKWHKQIL